MDYEIYNVPRGTIEKYIELLLEWNKKINLVASDSKADIEKRHIIDSLQITKLIKADEMVFDIGSGAGFPGLMISYAGIKNVNLVEKITKKAHFLIAASILSKNIVKVYNQDIRTIITKKCDVITARALASIEEILELTQNLKQDNTRYILLKGKNAKDEIKKALVNWDFQYILHDSITSDEGKIIILEQVNKKNGKKS